MKENSIESSVGSKPGAVPNLPVKDRLESERIQSVIDVPVHSNLQNALRKKIDIAEIMVATATYEGLNVKYSPVQQLITYPLKRRVYFEVIAHVETELQICDEEELYALVAYVSSEINKTDIPAAHAEISTKTQRMTDSVMSRIKSEDRSTDLQAYGDLYDKIMSNYSNGKFTVCEKFMRENSIATNSEAVEILAKMAIFDKIYQTIQRDAIQQQIIPAIDQIISTAISQGAQSPVMKGAEETVIQMKKLSIHPGNERQTFLLAGAPACGKGSILAKVLIQAHTDLGIDPSDLVKINTDSHRVLVSQNSDLGDDKKLHVSLNNDESSYITTLAYDKMREKIANNSAPHMLIDGVAPTQDRIHLGLSSDGHLDIAVVTLDVDESLRRADSRGEKCGRFVQTDYLIKSHEVVSEAVFNLIKDRSLQDKSVTLTLYDNNDVSLGEEPTFVVQVDFKTKSATVESPAFLMAFHDKMYGDRSSIKNQFNVIKQGKSVEQRASDIFQTAGIADNLSDKHLDASI